MKNNVALGKRDLTKPSANLMMLQLQLTAVRHS
jgi:hypothetical protein